jgi:hypothetical protein
VVRALLAHRADPNVTNRDGVTALILASQGHCGDCVEALLEGGANPAVTPRSGWTALDEAAAGDPRSLAALLGRGESPDRFNPRGRTPLQMAAWHGSLEAVRILLKHGASPDLVSKDRLGWTATTFARQAGHGSIVLELRRAGAAPLRPHAADQGEGRGGYSILTRAGFRALLQMSRWHDTRGLSVGVLWFPANARKAIWAKLGEAIDLVFTYDPRQFARLRRDLPRLWIAAPRSNRGAYLPDLELCMLDSRYVLSPGTSAAEIASTIVHEAMHARIHHCGIAYDQDDHARIERLCCEAQVAFAQRLPQGKELVERARENLRRDPLEWTEAARLERELAHAAELWVPKWQIRLLQRRWRRDGKDRGDLRANFP